MQNIVEQMWDHAAERPHEEVCGLVISSEKKSQVLRGVNVAKKKFFQFDLDPEIWERIPDGWEVTGTYHSHPTGIVNPSDADLTMCEATNMPMHIVCAQNKAHRAIEPHGYEAPYLKRTYVLGVHDCYSLVHDWYRRELGVALPKFLEQRDRFLKGASIYLENFKAAGFKELVDMPVQHGDLFLIQVASEVPNHAAIWLEGGRILHHVVDRVSTISPWTGYWAQHATNHIRHTSRF